MQILSSTPIAKEIVNRFCFRPEAALFCFWERLLRDFASDQTRSCFCVFFDNAGHRRGHTGGSRRAKLWTGRKATRGTGTIVLDFCSFRNSFEWLVCSSRKIASSQRGLPSTDDYDWVLQDHAMGGWFLQLLGVRWSCCSRPGDHCRKDKCWWCSAYNEPGPLLQDVARSLQLWRRVLL